MGLEGDKLLDARFDSCLAGLRKMFICCAAQRSAIHLFTPPTSASDLFESRVSGSSSEVASRARNSRSGSVLCATPKQ